jgi:anti-sigma factor RsiW
MSIKFTCDDKPTLVEYLYGEADQPTRQAVEAHLSSCAACAAEVLALGDVRAELGLWVAPDAELDFAIVKKSAPPADNVLRPARWWQTVPGWAQAAAAILVLAAGASIANLQIRSGPDGFSVSTGWLAPAPAPAPAAAPQDDAAWRTALVSLERDLRSEIQASRAQTARAAAATAIDEATLRRVQQLIADAEQRHERALAMRLIDFQRDINLQRRADLQMIGRGLVNSESELMRQRQWINNVMRVSSTPPQ